MMKMAARGRGLVKEVVLSLFGAAVTALTTVFVIIELKSILAEQINTQRWSAAAMHLLFCAIVVSLIYGGFVYLLTRAACYFRKSRYKAATNGDLARFLRRSSLPALSILIPSYREEPEVVLRTLLSAMLQVYPNKRAVLLIDDQPRPKNRTDQEALVRVRLLPRQIESLLAKPRGIIAALDGYFVSADGVYRFSAEERRRFLREALMETARWFEELAHSFCRNNHEEALFIDKVLLKHRDNCRVRAGHVAEADMRQREHAGSLDDCLADHLCFLRSVFSGKLSSFERKRFDNLSHEPNKAMNLNSYIGIMGSAFRFEKKGEKELLVAAPMEYADLTVEESEYIVTLDADSIILPDYVLRLLYMMEQPGNERLAVIQTPYNAFPFAPGRLEQVAGATTDVQYIIHQGFTAFSGTYWVGANALLRKQALNDIAVCERERGYSVVRYIQDRTVIEDTESSIDLVARDWRLYNYPERLAFSATPPDFGALIIQRRRWANGGLIILPKLLRYLLCNAYHWRIWFEGFFRVHYLISIAAVNVGLLTVLALPFTESVRSWWLPLSALPYFVLYARDLRLSGYRRRDVFGVYAINLLLIPVNLAGVFKSIEQMLSKSKIPFGRTPKVNGRTAASPFYVAAVYFLFAQWLLGALVDVYYSRWLHAAFASVNAAFLAYAVVGFAGLRETWADLVVPLRAWRRDFRRRWVYPAGRRIGLPLRPRYLYAERGVD